MQHETQSITDPVPRNQTRSTFDDTANTYASTYSGECIYCRQRKEEIRKKDAIIQDLYNQLRKANNRNWRGR